MLLNFIAHIWNHSGTPLRRLVVWITNAKFVHGVAGIIRDREGRVLLLKHRFWKEQRWGLPGGHSLRGESAAMTLRRELREETGLEVRPGALVKVNVRGGFTEFILLAETEGEPEVRSAEIMEARFFHWPDLPAPMVERQRAEIDAVMGARSEHSSSEEIRN